MVYVEDQFGNLVTSDNTTQVTASLRVGTGPLLGTTTVTVSGGIATFTNLQDNQAETIILLFTAPSLAKAQATPITVSPAAASRLSITAPATATAGTAFNITVTAFDPYDNVAAGYRGTIRFTSSDSRASLPSVYTFTSGDRGVHSFVNGVTLRISGERTITASDISRPATNGSTTVDVGGASPAGILAIAIAGDDGLVSRQFRETIPVLSHPDRPRIAAGTLVRGRLGGTIGAATSRQSFRRTSALEQPVFHFHYCVSRADNCHRRLEAFIKSDVLDVLRRFCHFDVLRVFRGRFTGLVDGAG